MQAALEIVPHRLANFHGKQIQSPLKFFTQFFGIRKVFRVINNLAYTLYYIHIMFEHSFRIVPHYILGPLRNRLGYIIAVAEIDDIWMVRSESPNGECGTMYLKSYEDVLRFIRLLNNDIDD